MDVIDIPKMDKSYRVLYDVKGRFIFNKITKKEASFKLCRVEKKSMGPNKISYIVTHDGRTIRFYDNNIKLGDTINYNLDKNEITDHYSMAIGNISFCSQANNKGRIG